ncbi:MFS transporter [Myxococcota bacterium]|jgi:MFS family permease|nr:MFS transporter [Myxococcota bacterium]MBU1410043.1 MFS transporter [Myxococcota bacterium]MBU1509938.1 MFS transporter [Myxococcota bacterium]PKN23963.1 MAG: hypothetical protein CVU65_13145 [Deltaproteobacteria bacterium HGW-Deltaproteobacteria-22]
MAETVRLYYLFRGLSSALLFKTFLVFFYLESGLNFAQIGILHSVFAATVILLEVPTGIWADRWGRGRVMGYGALAMAFAALGYTFLSGFWGFAFLEFLLAFGLTMTSGADSAFLYDALKRAGQEKEYADLEGKAGFAKHVGMATSALAGGFLAEIDLSYLFPASAIVVFLAYVAIRRMDRSLPSEHTHVFQGSPVRLCEALGQFETQKGIWWTVFYSALIFMFIRSSDTLLQPVLRANGYSYWKIGLAAAVSAMAAAVASRHTAGMMRKFSERSLLWALPAVLIVSYALFATGTGWVLALLFFTNVSVQGIYSPFTKTLLNRAISRSNLRATLLSMESSVKRMVVALMMPVVGVVVDRWGLSAGIMACVAAACVAGVVLLFTAPRRRDAVELPDQASTSEPGAGDLPLSSPACPASRPFSSPSK